MRARSAPVLAISAVCVMCLVAAACQSVPLLAPSGSSITLTATATALPLSGTTDLIATVVQASGTAPQSGTHIIFTTTLGSIQPADAMTDTTGRVVVRFNAGTASGTAVITASSGGANVGANGAVKIAVGAAAVSKIAISANPSTVPAAGGNSTIVATILDINGNVLPNLPVTFSTTAGSLNPSVINTDAGGNAQTVLFTTKTAIVTATAGVQGSSGGGATTPPTTPPTTPTTPTTASNQVTVNVNQVSAVTVGPPSPTTPFVGQSVTFALTYNLNANGSPIQRVVMDWGDGSPTQSIQGTPSAAAHAFTNTGSFSVRATAFDALGDFSTGAGSVTVTPKPIPVVAFAVSTANPTAGVPVTFTLTVNPAANSGTVIQDVTLDFGDGNSRDLGPVTGTISPQHVYTDGGEKTATVTATDSNGGTSRGVAIFFVQDQVPLSVSVTFTKSGTIPPGVVVSFTATVTPPPPSAIVSQYQWDFGDTTTNTTPGNQVTHTYNVAGTYLARVTVTTTRGATATVTTSVVVP